ncbi:MAG TPA: sigma-70 family RNA polymerase sigma factor, partial [Verrucomicrobiae bacterium]
MHADDMDLVREFATSGSEAAFATLVRRHVNLVYSAALRRLGNAPEAEEVAQNVFIILARKAGGLRRGTILSGWLYQTAQLTAANFQRAAIRRQHREQEAFMQFYESSEPNASWHQLSPLLEEAMARLGQNERDAIVLRFFENRTVREVAAALGLREDAAQKRVNRATDKLRDYFVRRGVQVSTAALLASLGTHAVQAAPVELASKIAATAALKAAAGSSSTLTLIKGALKIMAWTKAKTAIVSGVVVLLAAGTATVTIKEIREHRTYSWQVQDYATRRKILNEAPPMVKLVPTKFPPSQGYTMVNGKTLGTGISLSTLLCSIYDSSPDRVVAAEPLPKGNVDFIATLPDGKSNSAALQREIEKQFHLVGRKEMRDADVLLLTVKNRNAPGLKRSTVTSNMTNLDSPPG